MKIIEIILLILDFIANICKGVAMLFTGYAGIVALQIDHTWFGIALLFIGTVGLVSFEITLFSKKE